MLSCQKHLFSLDPEAHYLNCSYKAPLLKSVEEIAQRALIRERNPFRISVDTFFDDAEEVRKEFAKLVNTSSQNVAIMPSVSYGIASFLKNVNPKKGQNAVCVENEFPSDYLSVKKWSDKQKIELRVISPDRQLASPGKDFNTKLLDAIDNQTSLVIMSSIHWMDGVKFDLEAIGNKCKEVGAVFIVDGTQSVGALPMDVKKFKIDALICAGYKWLMGPYTTALAFVGEHFHMGEPLEESWMNRQNAKDFANLTDYSFEYTPAAGRFNMGQVSNFISLPMLKTALRQINEWSPAEIQSYAQNLTNPLIQYLEAIGLKLDDDQFRSHHLFGIKINNSVDSAMLKELFAENKIYISLRGNNIRVATNLFNTSEDISALQNCIEASRTT